MTEEVSQSYHCTVCDQPNQRIRGQQRQAHNQGVFQSLQAVFLLAGIDDVYEDRGRRGGARQLVLNRGTRRVKFRGYRSLRDVLVVRGERIAAETKWTDPDSSANVDIAAIESLLT